MARVIACQDREAWKIDYHNLTPGDNENVKGADGFFIPKWMAKTQKMLNDLYEAANKVDMSMTLVGIMIEFHVADGRAYYRVVKDKPLTLEHIPFCDSYQADPIMLRGLRAADIKKQVENNRKLDEMFKRSKEKTACSS